MEECVSLMAVSINHMKDPSYSQSVLLKCYDLWTHCKFPFARDAVFLVPLIVFLLLADKDDLFHLWKTSVKELEGRDSLLSDS